MAISFPVSADPCVVYDPVFPITKRVTPNLARTFLPGPAGIERRFRVGPNQTSPEYDVKFFLPSAAINIIDAFLAERARLGERFDWTPPDPGAVVGEFFCQEWSKTLTSHNMSELSATFTRSFTFE